MRDKKNIFSALLDHLNTGGSGIKGAISGFVIALLLVLFGLLRTLFILIITIIGYYIGVRYFSDEKSIKELLDRIFPPGRFR
ncbi:MAG TPA: DUF2273 domain-containing protein [Clostridiaceae bacterium]|nr:DUF2273 domain-containing protein [Clostridiaceae bacterium]